MEARAAHVGGSPPTKGCGVHTKQRFLSAGGHLARGANGGLLLRELAQCPDENADAFQDVTKYKYFNTNNLWVNLEALKVRLAAILFM